MRREKIKGDMLQCPRCGSIDLAANICGKCKSEYKTVCNIPILIDFDRSIVSPEAVSELVPEQQIAKASRIGKFLAEIAYDAPDDLMPVFLQTLKDRAPIGDDEKRYVLIIGGGTAGLGEAELENDPQWVVIRTDIYAGSQVDIICDGHNMPFRDGTFDAIICQAVLEHVLDPQQVVNEMHRVLRADGVVAAGTPFMQPVHMGAYDFTRFSVSGHRWLFRKFDEVSAGIRGGPGLSVIWSVGMLARALRLGNKGAAIVTALLSWLNWLDRLGNKPIAEDGANAVWFVGRRSDQELHPRDIISYYEKRNSQRA